MSRVLLDGRHASCAFLPVLLPVSQALVGGISQLSLGPEAQSFVPILRGLVTTPPFSRTGCACAGNSCDRKEKGKS